MGQAGSSHCWPSVSCFDFLVHSTIFYECAAKTFKLFDLFKICDVYVDGPSCPAELHCLCLVNTDLHIAQSWSLSWRCVL